MLPDVSPSIAIPIALRTQEWAPVQFPGVVKYLQRVLGTNLPTIGSQYKLGADSLTFALRTLEVFYAYLEQWVSPSNDLRNCGGRAYLYRVRLWVALCVFVLGELDRRRHRRTIHYKPSRSHVVQEDCLNSPLV